MRSFLDQLKDFVISFVRFALVVSRESYRGVENSSAPSAEYMESARAVLISLMLSLV